jgi:hypothetical protein
MSSQLSRNQGIRHKPIEFYLKWVQENIHHFGGHPKEVANTFANFETPAKIDLSELFFGRLKGYVDFFLPFSAIV